MNRIFLIAVLVSISSGLRAQCTATPGFLGGTGTYCIGSGVSVGIPETVAGQDYTWYLNSKPVKKLPGDGNGGAVSFNFAATPDLAGNYVVKASKPGCTPVEFGNVTVTIETGGLVAQTLTGGPDCTGEGVPVIMGGSQVGVNYQLYFMYDGSINESYTGIEFNGTGGPIDFGIQYGDGTYLVKAFGLGCSNSIVATSKIYFYATVPYSQGFNMSRVDSFPSCWRQGDPVIGNSNIRFETNSLNPATTPYEGSRYIFWNSASPGTHPAGNETRLLFPQVKPSESTTLDVEFYWYNNNNPALIATQNSNEGVQLQYYNNGWFNVGSFVPRHDGSLPSGTGQWEKKIVTVPNVTTNGINLAFKFRSEGGNNCSMDAITVKETPSCGKPSGLDAITYGVNSMTLGWASIPGSTGYQYAVTESSTLPVSGTFTANPIVTVNSLASGTKYYLYVRTQCAYGFSSWTSLPFYTLIDCSAISPVSVCTNFPVSLNAGEGLWNFAGNYPVNSTGDATPGKEKLYKFTPPSTGVYYLEDVSGTNYLSILYKAATSGCIDTGWTGIMTSYQGKNPIGLLEAGTEYLFVFDAWYANSGTSGTFRICKANVALPPLVNSCVDLSWNTTIPANSPKEEYILDASGNLLASIDFSQVKEDIVTPGFNYYVNTGALRRDNTNKEYLDRNFSFTSGSYLFDSYPVRVKFYFTNAELSRLINEPNDGIADVNTIADLNVSFSTDYCSFSADGSVFNLVPQSANGTYDAGSSFIESVTSISGPGSFNAFLHGGYVPLNYSCPSSPANYPVLPIQEGFNTLAPNIKPLCWQEQTFGSNVLFLTSSSNPVTTPFEGSRYVFYNSFAFPAGTATRLISAPFKTTGIPSVDVEFYWYNNNNPLFTSNIEGVQLEYSLDGVSWTNFTFLFTRHDGSLPPGTGKWNKKRVTMPPGAGNQSTVYVSFVFFSQYGDNCALDAVRIAPTPPCGDVQGLTTTSITGNSVNFNWTALAGVSGYQYAVSTSATPPVSGTSTSLLAASVGSLVQETKYYIHVRPQCSPGIFGGWTSLVFETGLDCALIPSLTLCTENTTTISSGTGSWNFAGVYPNNSVGYATPGKEKMYKFLAPTTGVYYIEVLSATGGYVDYFYRQGTASCNGTGWTGIRDLVGSGKVAIGLLQGGTDYYILLDAENITGATQKFKICKATTGIPPYVNSCIGLNAPYYKIPANSPREEFIIDDAGNLIASLDFSGVNNNLGFVYLSYYLNNDTIRRDQQNKEYLDRNITIYYDTVPLNPVKIKMFFTNNDLQRLINEPNDGIADVNSVNDLSITSILQSCSGIAEGGAVPTLLTQTTNGNYDANSRFVQFSTPSFGTFFLHGGSIALFNDPDNPTIVCPGGGATFTAPEYAAGYTYQWQVNTGSGFVNISDNGNYAGTGSPMLSLNALPSTFYGYKYRCVATNGASTFYSNIRTLKFGVTWNGSINTSWNLGSNYNCGVIPDNNTDVLVPGGLINYPSVLVSGASCRSIMVKPGASVNVAPGIQLNITGK